jgi:hypothetical protein
MLSFSGKSWIASTKVLDLRFQFGELAMTSAVLIGSVVLVYAQLDALLWKTTEGWTITMFATDWREERKQQRARRIRTEEYP